MVKLFGSLALAFIVACGFSVVASAPDIASASRPASFGDPLPGLTRAQLEQFGAGQEEFEQEETAADGLGPVFNNTSCAACHTDPVVGGDSPIVETRFGRLTGRTFDPMTASGGSLLQSQGIGPVGACFGETVPPEATLSAQRKTTPLFGLGLVDNVPDHVFIQMAEDQQRKVPAVAGRPHPVEDVATGTRKVGRFGWKAQVATLRTFAGDAYLNEMGITTPMFPHENAPQGDASLLATCDAVADPEDDGTGIQAFTDFMTFLGPPPRGPITASVQAGEAIFTHIGCAICHAPTLETGPHAVAALHQVAFQPFSDFLLHDIGSLGDGITQGQASGQEMRTAPLWGVRVRTHFLHDGQATTLEEAILAHDGQGQEARRRFRALSSRDLRDLLAFLNSL